MLLAKIYAEIAAKPDHETFRVRSMGASLRTGPYAGLSGVATVLSETSRKGISRYRGDFAELAWHARDLMHDVSPFADEMHHAPSQECHARLTQKLPKESDRA